MKPQSQATVFIEQNKGAGRSGGAGVSLRYQELRKSQRHQWPHRISKACKQDSPTFGHPQFHHSRTSTSSPIPPRKASQPNPMLGLPCAGMTGPLKMVCLPPGQTRGRARNRCRRQDHLRAAWRRLSRRICTAMERYRALEYGEAATAMRLPLSSA